MKEKKQKALILVSVASMIDQFNMSNIKLLQEMDYDVEVVADFLDGGTITRERVENLKERLQKNSVEIHHVAIPRKITNIRGIFESCKQVKKLFEKKKYAIVHCQSPIGGVIARLALVKSRKMGTRVIYTAHGFHFYEGAPLKNWLFFYPVEKICARFTDVLITINHEDFILAKRKLHAGRVVYVPGVGIDICQFSSNYGEVEKKRESLGIKKHEIMMLSVGELSKRKNHEVVIRALKEIAKGNVKYFIVGKGELQEYLTKIIHELDLEKEVFLLGYRTDIQELCKSADLFVFPSHQEGLPVALMEAIASKTPVVCSDIRGNSDLVVAKKRKFNEKNSSDVVRCLSELVTEKTREELFEVTREEVEKNFAHLQQYDIKEVEKKMKKIYSME